MTKLITVLLLIFTSITIAKAQLYTGRSEASTISFFSKSPLEDIYAINKKTTIVLKTTTNDIQFGVPMISFKFRKSLMEEHFNENYAESAKYPICTFKGKINEQIDYTKDGEYKVSAKGTLNLHGVTKELESPGTLTIKGNEIVITTTFKIKVADYNIKVPSLYVRNIAEVVDVTVNAILVPFEKK